MAPISDYEKNRLKNIEDNKKVLAQLGLLNPYRSFRVVKKPVKKPRLFSSDGVEVPSSRNSNGSVQLPLKRRKSLRLRGELPTESGTLPDDYVSDDEDEVKSKKSPAQRRPNSYGEIRDVEVGTWWAMRVDCSHAGIHRPTVAGIHGDSEEGAYSIALSGGYEDNIDLGDCFTYTGEGGRDLKGTRSNPKNLRTAPQSKDQQLSRGNLALYRSVETKRPVRVIRGFKLPTQFAPQEGYRYDGLYSVTKAWFVTGASGYGVWKFALQRRTDQAPPPWEIEVKDVPCSHESESSHGSVTSDRDGEKDSVEASISGDSGNLDH